MEKKPTKKQLVLDALASGEWTHMQRLNRIAFRYGARIEELRKEGHIIETRRIGDGEFDYRLLPREPKQLTFI